jgi:hypothetical protein
VGGFLDGGRVSVSLAKSAAASVVGFAAPATLAALDATLDTAAGGGDWVSAEGAAWVVAEALGHAGKPADRGPQGC